MTGVLFEKDSNGVWIPQSDRQPTVQLFTSAGTWTKPADARMVLVKVIGAGGGGGSGCHRPVTNTTDTKYGGFGGGGGAYAFMTYAASQIPETVAVIVGAGGLGGPMPEDSSNGLSGLIGGESSFGNVLKAAAGTGGLGGATTSQTGNFGQGGQGMYSGSPGGSSSTGTNGSLTVTYSGNGAGGGSGGAGLQTGNSQRYGARLPAPAQSVYYPGYATGPGLAVPVGIVIPGPGRANAFRNPGGYGGGGYGGNAANSLIESMVGGDGMPGVVEVTWW